MNPVELNRIIDESQETSTPHHTFTKKKIPPFNETAHGNSEDFKNLGNLHTENRAVEYFPQDTPYQFIKGSAQHQPGYDFGTGGLSYNQRVPDNLVGDNFKTVRQNTDNIDKYLVQDMQSQATTSSGFPLTTNQDFYGPSMGKKLNKMDLNKKNFKAKNTYTAYVEAMFNWGVFSQPLMDQC